MFRHIDEFSNSLAQIGVKKGTEIPVCMTLCPEFIYLLLAASKLGAVVNIFGDWFAPDYIDKIVRRNTLGAYFLLMTICYRWRMQSTMLYRPWLFFR